MSRKVFKIDDVQYEYSQMRKLYPNISFPEYSQIKQADLPPELTLVVIDEAVQPELTLDELKNVKKSEIADARYIAETDGIVINDAKIKTDRESQALIMGAAFAASLDNTYSVKWKTANGFIDLSAVEILSAAQAVRKHVQECFNAEAKLAAKIDACATKDEIRTISWEM